MTYSTSPGGFDVDVVVSKRVLTPSGMRSATHDGDEPLQTLGDDGTHVVHIPHALIAPDLRILKDVQRVLPIPSSTSTGHRSEVVVDLQSSGVM
jgi:hypothetical protein